MLLLAIDPGFERIGIAVINKERGEKEISFHERLKLIGEKMEEIIKKYKPKAFAIEKLYFTTNQKTVMGVSEARGVIVYIAIKNNLKIFEYTPPQIKVAVTGYGKADKNMVIDMVSKLIKIPKNKKQDDELDAIAIGLTCFACEKFSTERKLLQRK